MINFRQVKVEPFRILKQDEFYNLLVIFQKHGFASRYLRLLETPIPNMGIYQGVLAALVRFRPWMRDIVIGRVSHQDFHYPISLNLSSSGEFFLIYPAELESAIETIRMNIARVFEEWSEERVEITFGEPEDYIARLRDTACNPIYTDTKAVYEHLPEEVRFELLSKKDQIIPLKGSGMIRSGEVYEETEFSCSKCSIRLQLNSQAESVVKVRDSDCPRCGEPFRERKYYVANLSDVWPLIDPQSGRFVEYWVMDCLKEYNAAREALLPGYAEKEQKYTEELNRYKLTDSELDGLIEEIASVKEPIASQRIQDWQKVLREELSRVEQIDAPVFYDFMINIQNLPAIANKRDLLLSLVSGISDRVKALIQPLSIELESVGQKRLCLELTYFTEIKANYHWRQLDGRLSREQDIVAILYCTPILFSCKKTFRTTGEVMELFTDIENLTFFHGLLVATKVEREKTRKEVQSENLINFCRSLDVTLIVEEGRGPAYTNLRRKLLRKILGLSSEVFGIEGRHTSSLADDLDAYLSGLPHAPFGA